jgi:hypothetical protein
MVDFPSAVAVPGGASYAAPLLNFAQLGDWGKNFVNSEQAQTTQQLDKAKIQQIQQQIELSKAFSGGLPTDPQTGQIDYRKAAGILAAKGDIGGAVSLLQQQPPPMSPMFGGAPAGGPQPAAGAPIAPGPQPTSVQARPLPPPSPRAPQGDSGNGGTITDMVTSVLPAQNQTTGETIMKIAQVTGLDPNADLTPGQQKRVQGLLKKYAPEIAGPATASFKDRFAAAGGEGATSLPPSANAGTPSASPTGATAGRTGAPAFPGGASGAPVPAQAGQSPQAASQQPLVPQEPLPPGFKDPMQAIDALHREAARLGQTPGGQYQAQELRAKADRIEASIKPISVGAATTIVDPRTGRPIYQGPAAAAYGGAAGETGRTLDADANEYRMTGKLPPNMGRGIQGQQQATAIRTRAAEQEIAEGGDPNSWPDRWRSFAAGTAGERTLATRAAGLRLAENEASTLIPRVRDISGQISRTQYPSINNLILAAKKGTGDSNVIKLGIAVESLIPVYARILKPTGTVGQGDLATAHDILDKAWSDGQINAALDQMEVELKSARTALDKTIKEGVGTKGGSDQDSGKSSGSPAKPKTNTTPSGLTWSVE